MPAVVGVAWTVFAITATVSYFFFRIYLNIIIITNNIHSAYLYLVLHLQNITKVKEIPNYQPRLLL